MTQPVIRRVGLIVFLATYLALVLPVSWLSAPRVEARFFPIVESENRGVIERDGPHVCWSTSMHKVRVGIPAYALYTATYEGLPVSITVYLRGKGTLLTQRGFANHAPGERWITDYCTDLPLPLVGKPLTIEGALWYEVWHGLWKVPQPLPTLRLD